MHSNRKIPSPYGHEYLLSPACLEETEGTCISQDKRGLSTKYFYVSPPMERGTHCFGADPFGVSFGVGMTLGRHLSAQYLVNQCLDA